MANKIRVAQWATGGVGRCALRAIHQNPHLELVGCLVYDASKAGIDAGTIAGTDDVGVTTTTDADTLLELRPDVISYNGLWSNTDDFCRILEAGISIVTTSGFVTGHALGEENRQRIQDAAARGNSAIFGTGIHPGYTSYISLVAAGISTDIDNITVQESVDCTGYASAETWESCGFGAPLDTPGLAEKVADGTRVFSDGIYLAAEALAVQLDEVRYEVVFSAAPEDSDFGFMQIAKGCVAGLSGGWYGYSNGRRVIGLEQRWKMGPRVEPDIDLMQGYRVSVKARPNVDFTLHHSPPDDFAGKTPEEYMEMNLITTAAPAINAIPHLLKAESGIRTYLDLPLIIGKGFVR
jgi:hypothetical protein